MMMTAVRETVVDLATSKSPRISRDPDVIIGTDSRRSWMICFGIGAVLFCGSCILHAETVLAKSIADTVGVPTYNASWPLYVASLAGSFVGPVAGIVSKVWPKTLLVTSSIVSAVALACCYLIFGLLSWTLLLGLLFGASVGATKTACVLIVNACFKQYRSIGNGLSISGEAVAVYLGGPLISKLTNEYGVKGMVLVMSGVMLNAAVIAFFISRFTFDASEGPGEELLPLDSKSDVDLANKVIMEEAPVADEEKDLLKVPVERWPESLSDIMSRERRKTNIVECVAVIEHLESDSESDDALSWSGSELQDWRSSGETSAKDDAVNSPKVPWRSFSKDSDQSRLLKRRSWHNDEVDVKRRRSFLERWVSSSIESLRLARQAEKTYTKLKDSEDSPPSDINVSSRDKSTSRGNVTNVSTVPATDAISTISSHSKLSSENQIQFHPPDGCVVQNADLLSVVENFPPEKSSNGTDAPGPIPAIVLEDAFSSGLSRSNTELSLENGDLSRNAALLSSLDQLALTVPGAPLKRRYSRLAQDIIIRQLQDKRRQERCGGHLNIFSNPTLYLICVANSVMFNSVVIFLTKLAEVLQMKSIPATLEDRLMPTFCIGNLAACLCSGWFTDEGHISVRRAIAVDFFILGGSMLIVSLHNSVNTFAVQSLLQGWAFGQSKALAPVLLVDTLGVGSCGLAYGVVSFATGVSALIGQLLVVHFRDSYGTQDFIFNFHGILALAIAGMFLVETRFNRALVRKRRPRAQEL